MADHPILIAGGGPVGVIAALALARQGLNVELFEAGGHVNDQPRAATMHPATLEMLSDLGMAGEVLQRGLKAPIFQFWDRPSGKLIAEFDHTKIKGDTPYPFVVQCEQHKLAAIAIEQLRRLPNARIHFSARVDSIELFEDRVQIDVDMGRGPITRVGCYLIGADGGRSTVRKQLGIAFAGYTFPERFLVVSTSFDFAKERRCSFRSFFSDPDEWTNLFKVPGNDDRGLWRVLFPTKPGETDDEALNERSIQGRLQRFWPTSGPYPIVHRNLYNVHQRVAARFHQGRAFLIGDAAHVNNPLGGLGLNSGIHDAVDLAGRLVRVLRDEEPAQALRAYDHRRRPINIEYVQQQSIANKKRLEERNTGAREANFTFLRQTAADPAAHRTFLLRTSLLESMRQMSDSVPITSAPGLIGKAAIEG
jgi:3-(3-hydroxy-phenyl)propionate hydroxylase